MLRLAVSRIRPREQCFAHARLGAAPTASALPSTRTPATLPTNGRVAYRRSLSSIRRLLRCRGNDHHRQGNDAHTGADERSRSLLRPHGVLTC